MHYSNNLVSSYIAHSLERVQNTFNTVAIYNIMLFIINGQYIIRLNCSYIHVYILEFVQTVVIIAIVIAFKSYVH